MGSGLSKRKGTTAAAQPPPQTPAPAATPAAVTPAAAAQPLQPPAPSFAAPPPAQSATAPPLATRHSIMARQEAAPVAADPPRMTRGDSAMPPAPAAAAEPAAFLCPLTHQLMLDPVVDGEGNTYERTAIEAWLQRSQTSPITRSYLSTSMLNSNRALREAIEALRQQRGEPIPTVAPSASAAALAAAEPAPDIPEEMITMSAKQFRMDANIGVEICVEPPKGSVSMPMDIVLVVDVSGSMDAAAMVDQGGQPVDVGFSVMDITKHALNTVIEALKPQDRMCIVAFSTSATVVMPMTQMVRANQDRAKALVAAMQPGGTTNLWDGMRVALRELETSHRGGSHMTSIFVLTDGVPTEHLNPPRGILETLKKHLAKSMPEARGDALLEGGPEQDSLATSSTIPPSIYTFGFGYALDTKLLVDIATAGKGCFSFIPDSGFVGTVLVHTLANVAVTAGKYCRLTLSTPEGAEVSVRGHSVDKLSSTKSAISLDSIAFGQSRTLIVSVTFPHDQQPGHGGEVLEAELRYSNALGAMVGPPVLRLQMDQQLELISVETEATVLRLDLIHVLTSILANGQANLVTSQTLIRQFVDDNSRFCAFENTRALLADAEGQVVLAVSKEEWYMRWGLNYVYSLLSAHRQQRCNNFKDLGVAAYGGSLFQEQRDRNDEIFSDLPPPVPSHTVCNNIDGTKAPVVNFAAAFNSSANPCFHPDALVRMADGSYVKVSLLKKGQAIAVAHRCGDDTQGSSVALCEAAPAPTVRCVVRTDCMGGREKMVSLNDGKLLITPWHPVWVDGGSWAFPASLAPLLDEPCAAVYNVLLDGGDSIEVGGVACVTLGHGIQDDAVAHHEYYGSQRVVTDLQGMPGFEHGLLHFRPGSVARSADGRVRGFAVERLMPAAHIG